MDFTTGEQPCGNFKGKPTYYGVSIHECYAKDLSGNYCAGKVSFCENCSTDHHSNGYESCPRIWPNANA